MGYTNFPNGVTSFGIPLIGGLPFPSTQGDIWHVKPSSGGDGNSGKTPDKALKTLAKALELATADQNDIVLLYSEDVSASGTTDYQSATLDWNKDLVHLIGVSAGSMEGQRSRISFASSYDTASNLFTLSASSCMVANIHFFAGVAGTAPTGCFKLTGAHNRIHGCHIAGIGHANNDIDDAYSLFLDAATENTITDCVIGLNTIARGTNTNHEIWIDGGSGDNVFKNCIITRLIEHATKAPLVRIEDSTAVGSVRYLLFDNCLFNNMSVNYSTSQTGNFKLVQDLTQGYIYVKDCVTHSGGSGTVKWCADDRNRIHLFNSPTPAADTAGVTRAV
jgi:hypothetical protein